MPRYHVPAALAASLGDSLLSLAWLLVCVAVIIVLAYLFTKYVAGRGGGMMGLSGGTQRFKVLCRLPLGREQSAALVQAGGRFLLLGVAPSGVTLLAELTPEEGKEWDPPEPPDGPEQKRPADFRALMQRLREKK